ncbi:phage/plasmid primase, P4 family [Romboutsia sp. 1001216sp1]|uniref:DNA primase family protein n=1 Tax=Romboutsia sp. 1001216sp1 TaxID=2986997 RepID=UPI002330226D|nr:phage/plasmid primase, P4 family [Romboutsia sp. 1001216sp1]MDB8789191.1 phage/plasmid primase, P4 family [Romboutsia sp. 1001216sp1]
MESLLKSKNEFISGTEQNIRPLFKKVTQEDLNQKYQGVEQSLKPIFKKIKDDELDQNKDQDKHYNLEISEVTSNIDNEIQIKQNNYELENIFKKSEKVEYENLNTQNKVVLKNNEVNQYKNIESEVFEKDIKNKNKGLSLEYLYRYFINIDYFRIINGNLYIYDLKYVYLRYIPKHQEEVEINKLIEKEYRIYTHPTTIYNLIKKLKADPELQISYEELNRYKDLINCKNGVVDVRTGNLLPHSREYKFNYVINANYNINSQSNLYYFKDFVNTSLEGDNTKINLLLEILGYLVSGYTNAKKAFVFLGKPHSGKSMISRLIGYLVGENNVSNIPIHKLGERFLIAEYSTNKLNIGAEIGSTNMKNIETFKAIVGNDYLQAEYKGRDSFSFKSEIKLLFCGNQMPNISDSEVSDAFTDRLIFLIFDKTIPKEQIDYNLEERLKSEIDGIFTASIFALRELIRRNFKFTQPYDSNQFAEYYKNKQNHIQEFVLDRCVVGINQRIHTKDLYDEYIRFCLGNCIQPYSEVKFGDYIEANNGIKRARFRLNGNNLRGFLGIGLK